MLDKFVMWVRSVPTVVWVKNGAGIFIGGVAGYIYYIKVGCFSGTCPITSNPYMTILWGSVIGYLLADMIRLKNKG